MPAMQIGHRRVRDRLLASDRHFGHSRQARALGRALSMQHFKVQADDLIFNYAPMVEYLSFMAVMKTADVHIYARGAHLADRCSRFHPWWTARSDPTAA